MTPSDVRRAVALLTGSIPQLAESIGYTKGNIYRLCDSDTDRRTPRKAADRIMRAAVHRRDELTAWIEEQGK